MSRWAQLLLLATVVVAACDQAKQQRSDAAADFGRVDGRRDRAPLEAKLDLVSPGSDRCQGAPTTAVGLGTLELQGTTSGASNEYGSAIRCGESSALEGPQRYFRLELEQGTSYRFELRPSFDAVLLLSSNCGAEALNTDCGSQGATGDFRQVAAGGSGEIFFTAPLTGAYWLTVDSSSAAAAGPFSLTLEGFTAPANSQCLQAQPVSLSDGQLLLEGSTRGSIGEFPGQLHCGLDITLDGPQLYYTVVLEAGSWYRVELAPQFSATVVLASSGASCSPQNLEVDCSGRSGSVLRLVPAGGSAAAAFSPSSSGAYLLAVKSPSAAATGSFKLQLSSFTPPGNMICSAATTLLFSAGSATAAGSTQSYLNDLGSFVRCGPNAPALLGPQAYYKVELQALTYQLLLKPSFTAVLAIGESCQTLAGDCGSGGLSGTALTVPAGKTGATLFRPATAGSHTLVVDSAGGSGGDFSLEVQEYVPPQNGSCSVPKVLVLSGGTALESGDTTPLKNDLEGVTCGLGSAGPWSGPQAYYKVSLQGGRHYQIDLQPEPTFDPALYAFPTSTGCNQAEVNAACAGLASDNLGAGLPESLLINPVSDTEMILAVDSWWTSEVGSFALSVVEK